jgi:hypothetical protein
MCISVHHLYLDDSSFLFSSYLRRKVNPRNHRQGFGCAGRRVYRVTRTVAPFPSTFRAGETKKKKENQSSDVIPSIVYSMHLQTLVVQQQLHVSDETDAYLLLAGISPMGGCAGDKGSKRSVEIGDWTELFASKASKTVSHLLLPENFCPSFPANSCMGECLKPSARKPPSAGVLLLVAEPSSLPEVYAALSGLVADLALVENPSLSRILLTGTSLSQKSSSSSVMKE